MGAARRRAGAGARAARADARAARPAARAGAAARVTDASRGWSSARARARRRSLVWALVPTYPELRLLLPPGLGARARCTAITPTFEAYAAPTQHPLYLALCAAARRCCGERRRPRARARSRCCRHVALTCRRSTGSGAAVFGRWRGRRWRRCSPASSFAFLLYAARAYVDVPFLALVVWAGGARGRAARGAGCAVDGAARARRAAAPRGLGARAACTGCGASAPRGRRAAARSPGRSLAPLRLVRSSTSSVTGDPLHSLHATSGSPTSSGRARGLAQVPRLVRRRFARPHVARPPVALLGARPASCSPWRRCGWRRAARAARAVRRGRRSRSSAPASPGLSILPRYLTVPAVALCLFAGYALLGFTTLPAGDARRGRGARRGRRGGARAVFVVVKRADASADAARPSCASSAPTHDDLVALLDDAAVRARAALRAADVPELPARARHALDPRRAARRGRRAQRPAPRDAASRSSSSARRRCAASASPPARARRPTCRSRLRAGRAHGRSRVELLRHHAAADASSRPGARRLQRYDACPCRRRAPGDPQRRQPLPQRRVAARARSAASAHSRSSRSGRVARAGLRRAAPRPTPSASGGASSPRAPTCARPPGRARPSAAPAART